MSGNCVACGSTLDPGATFCGVCGAAQGTPSEPKAAAMQEAPAAPAGAVHDSGEQIGGGTVVVAAAGLVVFFGVMLALALVVRDTNAEARETEVLAGKVSLIGTAKVREWSAAAFTVRVPAKWANVATGQALKKGGGVLTGNQIHAWHGRREDPKTAGTCDRDVACLSIQIDRQGFKGKIASARTAALNAQRDALDAPGYKYRDLGPITALGGRSAWRWVFDQGGLEKVTYFFATCSGGKQDAQWTVRTVAPAGEYEDQNFAAILSSLETTSKPAPASGDCSGVLDR